MKIFLDTANLADIEAALQGGFIQGITTNPSLMAKEPKANYLEHLAKIAALAQRYGGHHSFSVEVFSSDPQEIINQAKQFVKTLGYDHLAIKVHISHRGQHNLPVIRALTDEGIAVNCTACMTPLQAMKAAAAGAKYVSLFYNRIKDGGTDLKFAAERQAALEQRLLEPNDFDPSVVTRETLALLSHYPQTEIIVGSIRSVLDVKHAALAGAHIVTVAPKIINAALGHYKTDEAVDQFFNDFADWLK